MLQNVNKISDRHFIKISAVYYANKLNNIELTYNNAIACNSLVHF